MEHERLVWSRCSERSELTTDIRAPGVCTCSLFQRVHAQSFLLCHDRSDQRGDREEFDTECSKIRMLSHFEL